MTEIGMKSRYPDPETELRRSLDRIGDAIEKIRDGVVLFDPDELGAELMRGAAELESTLARLMGPPDPTGTKPGSTPESAPKSVE